jgi:hypothetical protein
MNFAGIMMVVWNTYLSSEIRGELMIDFIGDTTK